MKKRVLIITGDGGESYETWYAVHRFQEEGYETRVAAPSKKRLNLVMHDFEPGWDTYKEAPGYIMESDLTFGDVSVADYDAVVCIGGRAPDTSGTTRACWPSCVSSTRPGSGSSRSAMACSWWQPQDSSPGRR